MTEESISKKKLVIATDNFPPRWDGIARFLLNLIPRIKDEYDITVIAPEFPGSFEEIEGIHVVRLPLSRFKLGDYTLPWPKLAAIRRIINDADMVMCNSVGPIDSIAILSASAAKKPVFAYIHSIEWELFAKAVSKSRFIEHFVYFFTKVYLRIMYNKCTFLLVPSHDVSQLLMAEHISTAKIIVNLGIDINTFVPPKNKEEAKERLGIPARSIV